MNIMEVFSQAFLQVWYIFPILILAFVAKTSWFKGVLGEFVVNLSTKLFLNKEKYHLIKNVTLPTENGTTQIDHIIISTYGVFVVETKNYKGWIFGGEKQKTWTQKIYRHTSKFQNPLHQNYKHLKTLESLLELNDHQLHSVIVFIGDSTFKTSMPKNVTYGGGYIRFVKSFEQPVLTDGQVTEIITKIETGRLIPSFKTNREHVHHVKEIVNEKKVVKGCPKCGSPMVLREAKSGKNEGNKFWGCSTFPKCRGIANAV